jgi:hypothetical protein
MIQRLLDDPRRQSWDAVVACRLLANHSYASRAMVISRPLGLVNCRWQERNCGGVRLFPVVRTDVLTFWLYSLTVIVVFLPLPHSHASPVVPSFLLFELSILLIQTIIPFFSCSFSILPICS